VLQHSGHLPNYHSTCQIFESSLSSKESLKYYNKTGTNILRITLFDTLSITALEDEIRKNYVTVIKLQFKT